MAEARRRRLRWCILAILIGVAALWFYPKARVVGGLRGGPIGPGESDYREDFACLGVAYDCCPDWPDYGCDKLCFGWTVGRTCSIETYDPARGVVRTSAVCQGPGRATWWTPPLSAAAPAPQALVGDAKWR